MAVCQRTGLMCHIGMAGSPSVCKLSPRTLKMLPVTATWSLGPDTRVRSIGFQHSGLLVVVGTSVSNFGLQPVNPAEHDR